MFVYGVVKYSVRRRQGSWGIYSNAKVETPEDLNTSIGT